MDVHIVVTALWVPISMILGALVVILVILLSVYDRGATKGWNDAWGRMGTMSRDELTDAWLSERKAKAHIGSIDLPAEEKE